MGLLEVKVEAFCKQQLSLCDGIFQTQQEDQSGLTDWPQMIQQSPQSVSNVAEFSLVRSRCVTSSFPFQSPAH